MELPGFPIPENGPPGSLEPSIVVPLPPALQATKMPANAAT
jgi:hypothetical protein